MKLPDQMTYIAVKAPGGPEAMTLATSSIPSLQPHELLVKVLAAGVNRPDLLQREGKYPPPPDASPILGLEVAGEVVAVGSDAQHHAIGDRVCALTNGGGYAEYCAVPWQQTLRWPNGYDAVHAAAIPETYFTVWANLFQMGHLSLGESVLIHGGSGGIGTTAVQLAKEFGCRVFATDGTKGKCDAIQALGASVAINYREQDFEQVIREVTQGHGVNVILDVVGAPYFARNLRCLTKDGRLICASAMQGSSVSDFEIRDVMTRRLHITGSTMRPRTTAEKGAIASELLQKVWPVLDAGRCGPVIYEVFPFTEMAEAHRLMESNSHIGKIVLKMGND
jgi:NADPH2:quinone reductase